MKAKINPLDRAALFITKMVSNMWCAIAFALLALVSLPEAIRGGVATLVAWTAQTFIQLVLLSIIMVGQELQNKQNDEIAERHYNTMIKHEKKIDLILKKLEGVENSGTEK